MKKAVLLLSSVILSSVMTLPVFAGQWVHTPGYNTLWSYVKDNGQYANNEWVLDNNTGVWYWISGDIDKIGYINSLPGIAPDGYRFNTKGEYIDMNAGNRKFINADLFSKVHTGMTYEQVTAILGKEHEVFEARTVQEGNKRYDYYCVLYFDESMKGSATVLFENAVAVYTFALWGGN